MYQLRVVRENIPGECELTANSSMAIYNQFAAEMESYDRERFEVLHLNAQNEVMARELISIGSLSAAIVSPREVFKGAILNNSSALILFHNHPSGNLTADIVKLAKMFEMKVHDHIIFGDKGRYFSFASEGLLS